MENKQVTQTEEKETKEMSKLQKFFRWDLPANRKLYVAAVIFILYHIYKPEVHAFLSRLFH